MAFDPKAIAKSPVVATAGGFLIALGIFKLIEGGVENLIRPIFNVINGTGNIRLWDNTYLGCGGFLSVCIICAAALVAGGMLIRTAGKQ